jgi:hypothetical protein
MALLIISGIRTHHCSGKLLVTTAGLAVNNF